MQQLNKAINSPAADKLVRFAERLIYPLAVFIAACGLAYWYWTTTPSYALTAIVVAVKNHDAVMFEKYVDVDSLVSRAFDNLIEGPGADRIIDEGSGGMLGTAVLKRFKPEILEFAHEEVLRCVETGKRKMKNEPLATVDPVTSIAVMNSGALVQAAHKNRPQPVPAPTPHESPWQKLNRTMLEYGVSPFGYRGIKYLKVNGHKAHLAIEFFAPRLHDTWTAQFLLEDAGGHYRVTELTNVSQLMNTYLQTRDSPL